MKYDFSQRSIKFEKNFLYKQTKTDISWYIYFFFIWQAPYWTDKAKVGYFDIMRIANKQNIWK